MMNALRPHRVWIALLLLGLTLLFFTKPLVFHIGEGLQAREIALTAEKERLLQMIHERREDAATAKEYGSSFDEERKERLTAPADREAALVRLETLAAAARFTSFASSMGREEPLPKNISTPDTQNLRQSTLTLEGLAPHDLDLYRFLDRLGKVLPGRLDIQKLSLARLPEKEEATLGDANLSFTAHLLWIAPASQVEGKP